MSFYLDRSFMRLICIISPGSAEVYRHSLPHSLTTFHRNFTVIDVFIHGQTIDHKASHCVILGTIPSTIYAAVFPRTVASKVGMRLLMRLPHAVIKVSISCAYFPSSFSPFLPQSIRSHHFSPATSRHCISRSPPSPRWGLATSRPTRPTKRSIASSS